MAKKTVKARGESVDALHRMRHSLAHVLAQAVLHLYPKTKFSIGPPIETGCYYDFLFEEPISDAELPRIEEEMRTIIRGGQTFRERTLDIASAKKYWGDRHQPFKVELVEDLHLKEQQNTVTHYENIAADGKVAFVDLCKGGHLDNVNQIPLDGFTLMSLAGAYWRGDEKREQLTRIYVAAFSTKAELEEYLENLERASKVDHRKLGKELQIFVLSDLVGPGLPMLAPNGAMIRWQLQNWIWEELNRRGYSFVFTPNIGRTDLYEVSGHLSHFKDDIFPFMEADGARYVLKPMNCPHHVQIYQSQLHSYRDLPVRLAEFGTVYRYEQRGEVGGLTRVRGFTQDDAHHFVRPDQIEEEVLGILELSFHIYRTLGFDDFLLRLSLHDPKNMTKYIGREERWQRAEKALRSALTTMKVPFVERVGEAAFYGPKIDLIVKDAFGREWQLGTIPQLDYNMPERFDLTYTDRDGSKQRPVMMHRAIFGSFERLIGLLIEHFGGLFPLWLAPVQVAVLPVAAVHGEYAKNVEAKLVGEGMRVQMTDPADSLGKRIREGELQRIPYLLVVGDKEVKNASVTVRNIATKEQATVSLSEFLEKTVRDIRERRLTASLGAR